LILLLFIILKEMSAQRENERKYISLPSKELEFVVLSEFPHYNQATPADSQEVGDVAFLSK